MYPIYIELLSYLLIIRVGILFLEKWYIITIKNIKKSQNHDFNARCYVSLNDRSTRVYS